MARTHVKIDNEDLKVFQKKLDRLTQNELSLMYDKILKELAAQLLDKVIRRTPVGDKPDDLSEEAAEYWKGYTGGTLRRGWTSKTEDEARAKAKAGNNTIDIAEIRKFVESVHITRRKGEISLIIHNPVHYADYVEYGHRQKHVGKFLPKLGKTLKAPFVEGKYMLKLSEDELRRQSTDIISRRIEKFLGSVFDGK